MKDDILDAAEQLIYGAMNAAEAFRDPSLMIDALAGAGGSTYCESTPATASTGLS